jgi:predicted GNAT family acetyltransferase
MSEPVITDVPDIHHYELRSDGELIGHINYRDDGGRRVVLHTEVDKAHSGKGLATKLIVAALDDIRAKGMRVVALCPLMAAYLVKHRDYDDIVDPPHVLDSKV